MASKNYTLKVKIDADGTGLSAEFINSKKAADQLNKSLEKLDETTSKTGSTKEAVKAARTAVKVNKAHTKGIIENNKRTREAITLEKEQAEALALSGSAARGKAAGAKLSAIAGVQAAKAAAKLDALQKKQAAEKKRLEKIERAHTRAIIDNNRRTKQASDASKKTTRATKEEVLAKRKAEKIERAHTRAIIDNNRRTKTAAKEQFKYNDSLKNAADSAALITGPLGGIASRISLVARAATAGRIAMLGIAGAIAGTFTILGKAIGHYAGVERQMFSLTAQIRQTNYAAGISAANADRLARSTARSTLQSTEGVRDAIKVLLQYESIQGEQLKRTIDIVAGVSEVTGQEAQAAARTIGKILEAPEAGFARLINLGVDLDGSQKNIIRRFIELGEKGQAVDYILGLLNNKFGTVGQEAAAGYAGTLDSLAQSFDDALEAIQQTSFAASVLNSTIGGLEDITIGVSGEPQLEALIRQRDRIIAQNKAFDEGGIGGTIGAGIASIVNPWLSLVGIDYYVDNIDRKIKSARERIASETERDNLSIAAGAELNEDKKNAREVEKARAHAVKMAVITTQSAATLAATQGQQEAATTTDLYSRGILSLTQFYDKKLELEVRALNNERASVQAQIALKKDTGTEAAKLIGLQQQLIDINARRALAFKANANERVLAERAAAGKIVTINNQIEREKDKAMQGRLDDRLKRNVISFQAYYSARQAIAARSVNQQITILQSEISAAEGLTGSLKSTEEMTRRLVLLQQQRATIAGNTSIQQATVERKLAEELSAVRTKLASVAAGEFSNRIAQIEQGYSGLIARLKANSDGAGVEVVQSLINVETAAVRMDQLKAKANKFFRDLQSAEEAVQRDVTVGILTETQARRELARLRAEAKALVEAEIPALERMAQASKLRGGAESVAELTRKVAELGGVGETVAADINGAFESTLVGTIGDLGTEIRSLSDLFNSLFDNLASKLAEIAAQQAFDSVFGSINFGSIIGGFFDAPVKHDGGIAGSPGATRLSNTADWIGAPKYHSGKQTIKNDEVRAILKKDEDVVTRDDPRHSANYTGKAGRNNVYITVDNPEDLAKAGRSGRQISRDINRRLAR